MRLHSKLYIKRFVTLFMVAVLGAFTVPASAGWAAATSYSNPTISGLTANPFVLRAADGTYYAYVNGFDFYLPFPVMALTSTDLATWTQVGNVLTNAGPWADTTSGWNVTSPAVRLIPGNPTNRRYVMYYSAKKANSTDRCIGTATASGPTGPFTPASAPLICPAGGAQDPSPVALPDLGFQELIYRTNAGTPAIYNQVLTADGLALHPSWNPLLLYRAAPTWWHGNTVERPAVTSDGTNTYLFFSGGTANTAGRAIGWTTCDAGFAIVSDCSKQTHFGTFVAGTSAVQSPSGLQVFSDADNQWIVYDGLPGGSCSGATCTGTRSMRIDKLCFAHGQPRTNAPSVGAQSLARSAACGTDIPGAALGPNNTVRVSSVTDNLVLSQPTNLPFRDGGSTAPLGGRVLWMFSDGFGREGCPGLTNTAALGVPALEATGPNWSAEPLDAGGCSSQFIPYTPEEAAFNEAHAATDHWRVALWEVGAVPLSNGDALAFFMKIVDQRCTFCYDFQGIGAVRIRPGRTVADRTPASSPVACNPTCLFGVADGAYVRPFINDGSVYAYNGAKLGRVPIGQVETRSAWRFWAGAQTWGAVADAVEVPGLHDLPDPYQVDGLAGQVRYNPYLDRFVNIVADNSFALSHMVIQTAPAPEGPWTPEQEVYDATVRSCGTDFTPYGALQNGELVANGGRVIPFTYARPGPNFGTDASCPGQVRMVNLTLL